MFIKRVLKENLFEIICAAFFLLITFSAYFISSKYSFDQIASSSMEPTLIPGKYYLFCHDIDNIQRLDIITFTTGDDTKTICKRIIGMPGDKITFSEHDVYVNGNILTENYIKEPAIYDEHSSFSVPDGCVFVLGDNRNHSKDSRYMDNPYIEIKNIISKKVR